MNDAMQWTGRESFGRRFLLAPLRRHCHGGECGRPGRIRGVITAAPSWKGHRYPVEIINHCVWL